MRFPRLLRAVAMRAKSGARHTQRERGIKFLCNAAFLRRHSRQLMRPNRSSAPAPTPAKEVFILGVTRAGRTFRPSDWAERLAGVMSQFRPGGPQPGSHLGYSPWCVPTVLSR